MSERNPWHPDLRCGDWREVLADVGEVDAVITDPPFSARTHAGQRTGSSTRKTTLVYDGIDEAWARDFIAAWAPRCRWWFAIWSDHTAQRWWEAALQDAGWYTFAPVIWLRKHPPPRMAGDGPTSAADYLTIARRRGSLPKSRRGSRPGYYLAGHHIGANSGPRPHPGGKSLETTRRLVQDYTRPGDRIADPCAGGGTTLLAAAQEGRRSVGAELDPETHAKAQARIDAALAQADLYTQTQIAKAIDQELPW